MERHSPLLVQMLRLDLEHLDRIALHVLLHESRERKGHLKLSDAHLDCYFLQAGHAEVAVDLFLFDDRSRVGVQPAASLDEPEKCVSIQKKLHDGM